MTEGKRADSSGGVLGITSFGNANAECRLQMNHFMRHDPEAVAIEALSFLAGRPEDLGRFLALSGIGEQSLRAAAADPAFLAGLLDFLLQDEALLLVFAEEKGFDPASIGAAKRRLDGDPANGAF